MSELIGASLDNDTWVVTDHLAGTPFWGMHRVRHRHDGTSGLLTTASAPFDVAALERALRLPPVDGVAGLRFHGLVTSPMGTPYGVVEDEPPGRPLLELLGAPWQAERAAQLVAALTTVVLGVYAHKVAPLRGLHPAVIAVVGGESATLKLSGLAPRWVRLLERSGTEFKRPLFEPHLEACEVWTGSSRPLMSSDVFSLCAILAWMLSGQPPYGTGLHAELEAGLLGKPQLANVPSEWVELLGHGLTPRPDDRPSAEDLLRALTGGP